METVIEENPAWLARDPGSGLTGLACCAARSERCYSPEALSIMFPMIAVAELDAAKAVVMRELTYLREDGYAQP
jgi:phosphotransferase system enzyme I (PtsP)